MSLKTLFTKTNNIMYEIIDITNDNFISVITFDKLVFAIHEKRWLELENPNKKYTIYNEKGLPL